MAQKHRIIVGISGASGVVMGYRLLQALGAHENIERHLIVTENARLTWDFEVELPFSSLNEEAECVHAATNMAAPVASGSFLTDGMIVIPCSMKSLAGIVHGYADNLLLRAADVCLKENRRLVLVPRETPLSRIHLDNLARAAELGCAIMPPVLTFYRGEMTMEQQIDHILGKILMQFGFAHSPFLQWEGKIR